MSTTKFDIKEADLSQAEEIASLFRRSRIEMLPFLPVLHSKEEDLAFLKEQVLSRQHVYVAMVDDRIAGFVAFFEEHLDHLYMLPEFAGLGIGAALLKRAKESEKRLELWVFQENKRAIQFYRKHGFEIVRSTDGSSNEENSPDHLMLWVQ